MIKKFTALSATAVLAAGALIGVSTPAQAASKTIYTQCSDIDTGKKLTKKTVAAATRIECHNLSDLGPLKAATKLDELFIEGKKKLKVTGTSKLRKLGITSLVVLAPVTDTSFAFVKDFPQATLVDTGPTPVSTFTNIKRLNNLTWLSVSINKTKSYASLSRLPKLLSVDTNVISGKADLASLAKLPHVGNAGFSGNFNQSLKPLLKSKHIESVYLDFPKESRKLSKGQTYKVPAYFKDAFVSNATGWPIMREILDRVKSPGVGMADINMLKTRKMGKIMIHESKDVLLYTPGKVDFDNPPVAQKSARVGETIRAKKPDSFSRENYFDYDAKCSFQWQRNKKDIKGATKLTYKAAPADAGKTLRLQTTCRPSAWVKEHAGIKNNTKYSGAVKVS